MKALFYSVKGGQGKTTHAISYAKYKEALYLTNDYESGTIDIYQDMFAENQLQIIEANTKLNFKNLENFDDVVFDFGGWVDDKIQAISKIVDVVIVPIYYQSIADLMPCIKTVNSISQFNKNIIILINNTETSDIKELKEHLTNKFSDFIIFTINKSKYINRLANEGKTLFELSKEGGLVKFNLTKTGLIKQINELYTYLDNIK